MEDLRKTIRPVLAIRQESESAPEQFQNEVLRPILKMQNDLLLGIFRHFQEKRKVSLNGMSKEKRAAWIAQSISNDHHLKSVLLGAVIGQFTMEEWARYLADEQELRRRLTHLLTQRLLDQAKELV